MSSTTVVANTRTTKRTALRKVLKTFTPFVIKSLKRRFSQISNLAFHMNSTHYIFMIHIRMLNILSLCRRPGEPCPVYEHVLCVCGIVNVNLWQQRKKDIIVSHHSAYLFNLFSIERLKLAAFFPLYSSVVLHYVLYMFLL